MDDSDLIADTGYANNPELTMERMQTTIDAWEGVAKTTGGTIAHGKDKSWWYLIHFTWDDKGKWKYGDLKDLQLDKLTSTNDQGETIQLTYITPDKAQEMLGVWLAPDGNNSKQIKVMKNKAYKFAESIKKATMKDTNHGQL